MLRKKTFYIGTLVFAACLIVTALLLFRFTGDELKSLGGTCIGIGSGLFATSIVSLLKKRMEEKNPEMRRQNEIDYNDERNALIRYRAKAKAADIMQWFIIGVAFITIIADAPLWVTLALTGVYALYGIIMLYYTGKYQNEI